MLRKGAYAILTVIILPVMSWAGISLVKHGEKIVKIESDFHYIKEGIDRNSRQNDTIINQQQAILEHILNGKSKDKK